MHTVKFKLEYALVHNDFEFLQYWKKKTFFSFQGPCDLV